MVELAGHYDQSAAPQEDFGAIPSGEYEAEIIESSIEDISKTKDAGKCLLLVWKVLNGDYGGRQVWQRLNLWFQGSEKTPGKVVQIANAQFATVREATGKTMPADSSELHHIPCVIRVSWQKDEGYDAKNEVKHVKARGAMSPSFSAPPGASAAPRSAPPPSAANGGGGKAMPWQQQKTA